MAFPTKTIQLHKEQGQVFQAIRTTHSPIFQQAPAGIGKALMASAAIWQWYQYSRQSNEVILITATTNHTIQEAARSFSKLVDKLSKGVPIILIGHVSKLSSKLKLLLICNFGVINWCLIL